MDNFEGSSGLDDGHYVSNNIISRSHSTIYAQELRYDCGGNHRTVGWSEQGFRFLGEFLDEFTDVFNEGLERKKRGTLRGCAEYFGEWDGSKMKACHNEDIIPAEA